MEVVVVVVVVVGEEFSEGGVEDDGDPISTKSKVKDPGSNWLICSVWGELSSRLDASYNNWRNWGVDTEGIFTSWFC